VVPNALNWPGSLVCVDIKRENWTTSRRSSRRFRFQTRRDPSRALRWIFAVDSFFGFPRSYVGGHRGRERHIRTRKRQVRSLLRPQLRRRGRPSAPWRLQIVCERHQSMRLNLAESPCETKHRKRLRRSRKAQLRRLHHPSRFRQNRRRAAGTVPESVRDRFRPCHKAMGHSM
jgi:hypothetical protein